MIFGTLRLVNMFGEITLEDDAGNRAVMITVDPQSGEQTYDLSVSA